MQNKYMMSAQELESINSELFDSFDPEQELWIIGGSTVTQSITMNYTYYAGHADSNGDYDIDW